VKLEARRSSFHRIIAVAFLLVMFLTSVTTAFAQGDQDYYPLAVGDDWSYQSTVGNMEIKITTVRMVTGGVQCYVNQIIFQNYVVEEQCLAWQGKQLIIYQRVIGSLDLQLTPPQVELDTPLKVGKQWTWSGTYLNYLTHETETGVTTCQVTGEETVAVPAGTFSAYVVTVALNVYGPYPSTATQRFWFAKGVGAVKEIDSFYTEGGSSVTLTGQLSSYHLTSSLKDLIYWGTLGGAVVLAVVLAIVVLRTKRKPKPELKPATLEETGQPLIPQATPPTLQAPEGATKFCRHCGAKIPRDSKFCEECGSQLLA